MAFIYVITNQVNGKRYVGKTTHNSINKRWKEHIKDSKNRKYNKRPLYNALNKYGIENFIIEQLEECSIETLEERELYWIDKLNTYHSGYNATKGGDGKNLYGYKEIASKYLELQHQQKTADYFGCTRETVKKICEYYKIPIKTSHQINKEKSGKPVMMLDKSTNEVLNTFNSLKEASMFCIGNYSGRTHISDVCKK